MPGTLFPCDQKEGSPILLIPIPPGRKPQKYERKIGVNDMKKATKFLALLLALVLTMGLGVTAFADEVHAGNNGTITIENAIKDQTYTIYEILYLESYDAANNAYSYKATTAWNSFINSGAIRGVYVDVNTEGYVTWKTGASAAEFAEKAQAYAKANNIANQGSEKAASTTVEFTKLDLGYYLLDSSLGTLCSLNTTKPDVTIREKNVEPTNGKQVEEDSNKLYGSVNDADIGQTVNFRSTITAQAGAEKYVFHDKMSAGLTYNKVTGITLNDTLVDQKNYEVKSTGLTDGCTFEVVFTQAFCDTLKANDKIVISYTATVNEKAVIGSEGNHNESHLSYGEEGTTTTVPSTTTTYTWEINIYKYTMVEANGVQTEKALAKAEFILYKDVKNGETTTRYYAVAAAVDGGYRFTEWTTDKAAATKFVTPDNGKFAIKGLDSDTYYLEETTPPAGYNALKEPVKIVIDNGGKVTYGSDNSNASPDVKVLNKTGTELPTTGGVGTTVFYVLGGILAVGAAVLLVTKKRMEQA